MGSRLENKSAAVRKRIEAHDFADEAGDEYEPSKFGGFPEYFRRKKIKLQNLDADLRARSADKPQIFRGIVANINGYTQPSLNDLHEMIVSHGGGFIQYLDGKTMVTHIIASSLTPKKVVEFRRYRIVKPAWIVDSVAAGRLLPWSEYRVVGEGVGQKVLGFANGQVVSQINNQATGYREQTDRSWYTSQFNQDTAIAVAGVVGDDTGTKSQTLPQSGHLSFDENDLARLDAAVAKHALLMTDVEREAPDQAAAVDCTAQKRSTSPANLMSLSSPHSPTTSSPRSPTTSSPSKGPNPRPTSDRTPQVPLGRQNSSLDGGTRMAAKLTAEEHNSILLADPRIRKSTVVNPQFLEQYYRESRLHHLSTWKADLKAQLKALTEEKSSSQKRRQRRPAGARRYILHVDFDSFFVAVSLKQYPQYKDRPCVVAHGGGSGSEIASCNYPARKFGISNGMWMKKAQELCKDIEVLPYDFPAYEEASRKFYDAILATGGVVQSVSIDEALIDVSALCVADGGSDGVGRDEGAPHREQAKADRIGEGLRAKVLQDTGCNVSVGVGSNILIAKVALRKAKPAGQFHLRPEDVLSFIGQLQVQDLPGVAWSLGGKLEELGIKLVKDIRECTKEKLINKLGPKTGEKLWDYARGIDRVEVGDVVTRKSVSAEVNWGVRFENQEQVDEFIDNLCIELQKRLIKERVKGRQLTLKIMRRASDAPLDPPKHLGHGKCDTHNKSVQLGVCTNDAKVISKETLAIMRGWAFSPGELRGIGIQMQKLEPIKSDQPMDGSQRRLQFKMDAGNAVGEFKHLQTSAAPDGDSDEIETPRAVRFIDVDAARPAPLLPDSPSKKLLNIQGTQFVMPTQVDMEVLRELPEDIRSRLMRCHTVSKHERKVETSDSEDQSGHRIESYAPSLETSAVDLPNQSQLDADTLAALPADVRSEVLGLYKTRNTAHKNQVVLPQSPRKSRILPPTKVTKSSRSRGVTRPSIFARSSRATSTLTQTNFVSRVPAPTSVGNDSANDTDTEPTELDPTFLAALPPELKVEVLHNHRQARLRHKSGIDTSLHSRPRAIRGTAGRRLVPTVGGPANDTSAARVFRLPPRRARPTFTKAKLYALPDLRGMLRDWTRAFWDEPPFEEDVAALGVYLGAVVGEEGDMAKALGVLRWLVWLVEEDSAERWGGDEMRERWQGAVERVREAVVEAVRDRGLGQVDL